jgi:hypothetical protein
VSHFKKTIPYFALFAILLVLESCRQAPIYRVPSSDMKEIYDQWVGGDSATSILEQDFDFQTKPRLLEEIDELKLPDGNVIKKEEINIIDQFFKPHLQESSGGWGGTGGSGVACFKGKKMISLHLLDYYEAPDKNVFFPVEPGESLTEYLNKILNKITPLAPYFAFQLRLSLKRLLSEQWIDNPRLPFVPDIGTEVKLPEKNCRRVQLAIRFAKRKKEGFPDVFLEVNHELLKKMTELNSREVAILNQAMFLFHEATYLLGVELGHKNSKEIRNFVRFFLDKSGFEFRERLNSLSPGGSLADSFLYGFRFFNFIAYRGLFLKEGEIRPFSNQSRRRSYAESTIHIEEIPSRLYDKPGIARDFDGFMGAVMDERLRYQRDHFSNEDSFLMAAFAHFQQGKLSQHFDYLLLGEEEDTEFVKEVCEMITFENLSGFLGKRPQFLWDYWKARGIVKTEQDVIRETWSFDASLREDPNYRASMRNSVRAIQYCSYYSPLSGDELEVLRKLKDVYDP